MYIVLIIIPTLNESGISNDDDSELRILRPYLLNEKNSYMYIQPEATLSCKSWHLYMYMYGSTSWSLRLSSLHKETMTSYHHPCV